MLAAVLGPAEVAAWGIMESVWDLFESGIEGLSEAGSIRLAYHLGKGDIKTAKRSTWKTLFFSTIFAILMTTILFICGDSLSTWFTSDPILQRMLNELVPIIGVGNILMVFGMVSWSLIGAQGRYRLATIINTIMSLCVTIPLATLFTVGFRFTLEGLVGAVIAGYSTTGLCLGYILLMTDWENVSKTIQEQNDESSSDDEPSSDDESSYDDEASVSPNISAHDQDEETSNDAKNTKVIHSVKKTKVFRKKKDFNSDESRENGFELLPQNSSEETPYNEVEIIAYNC